MRIQVRSVAPVLLVLVVVLAGCGGGGGSEDQQGGQQGAQQGGEQGSQDKGNAPESKIALGVVKRVNQEKERIVLKPSQGEGLMTFGIRPQAKITLDDEKAELADVKEGQQAQIEYTVSNDLKRARSLTLFAASETTN